MVQRASELVMPWGRTKLFLSLNVKAVGSPRSTFPRAVLQRNRQGVLVAVKNFLIQGMKGKLFTDCLVPNRYRRVYHLSGGRLLSSTMNIRHPFTNVNISGRPHNEPCDCKSLRPQRPSCESKLSTTLSFIEPPDILCLLVSLHGNDFEITGISLCFIYSITWDILLDDRRGRILVKVKKEGG